MPGSTVSASTIVKAISQLKKKRQAHLDAIAEIDETFAQLGIEAEGARRGPGRPRGAGRRAVGRGRRRTRRTFAVSGEEAVLAYVKKVGKPNAADVNKDWQSQGRGGKADNALSKLVKAGQLKRVKVKGERGSRYVIKSGGKR